MASIPPASPPIDLDELRRVLQQEYQRDPNAIFGSEDEAADLKILNDSIEAKKAERAAQSLRGMPMDPLTALLAVLMPQTYDNMANTEVGNQPAISALGGMAGSMAMVPGAASSPLSRILQNQPDLPVLPPKPATKNSLISSEPDWMAEGVGARAHKARPSTVLDPDFVSTRRPRSESTLVKAGKEANLKKGTETSEKAYDEGKWSLDKRSLNVNDDVMDADFVATPGSADATQRMNTALVDSLAKSFGEKPVDTLGVSLVPKSPPKSAVKHEAFREGRENVVISRDASGKEVSRQTYNSMSEAKDAAEKAMARATRAKPPKSDVPQLGDLTAKTAKQLDNLQAKLETAMGFAHEALMESGIPNIGTMKFSEIARLDHPAARRYVEVTRAQGKLRDEYTYRDNYHGSKDKVKPAR